MSSPRDEADLGRERGDSNDEFGRRGEGGSEPLLEAIVEDFTERLRAGERPDAAEVILNHPELAAELERRLKVVEMLFGASTGNATTKVSRGPMPAAIGRYEIRGILGEGASAVVYRAWDPKFKRHVALKGARLSPFGDSSFMRKFGRDARAVGKLRHANIVPLHEAGEHEGWLYIDFELIEGRDLETILREKAWRPFDHREITELVRTVAEALHHAHERGVVHRDIKPSNILIDADGRPQVTDFGLARMTDTDSASIESGVVGTIAYMPPEQADSKRGNTDARSDVYSLGVVLYRLLTGRLPFETSASWPLAIARILEEVPPKPRAIRPEVPTDLETICLKAMEKEPADRFHDAKAFAEELRRWAADEPLTVRPPTRWERLRRWSRRNRAVARVAGTAAILLAVVTVTLGWIAVESYIRANEGERLATEIQNEREAWALLNDARARIRDPAIGRREESLALIRNAQAKRGRLTRELPELELAIRSRFVDTLAVPEVVVRQSDKTALPQTWSHLWRVALHPSGNRLAIGTHLGPLEWKPGAELTLPGDLDELVPNRPRVSFSPDGKHLAFAPESGGLEIWDEALEHRLMQLIPTGGPTVLAVGFQGAGTTVRACDDDGRVTTWNLPGFERGETRTILEPDAPQLTAAAFDDTGEWLVVGDADGVVRTLTCKDLSAVEWRSDRTAITALAWSPDHQDGQVQLLAAGRNDGRVQVANFDGREIREFRSFPAATSEIATVQFSPDGRWILAGNRNSGLSVWDIASGEHVSSDGYLSPFGFAPGRNAHTWRMGGASIGEAGIAEIQLPKAIRRLTGHEVNLRRLAWSPDSRYLVTLDATFIVKVWDRERDTPIRTLTPTPGTFQADAAAVAIGKGGRFVAYASGGEFDSTAAIWDLATDDPPREWTLPGGFEELAPAGDDAFLLVREELEPSPGNDRDDAPQNVSTVVYELKPGVKVPPWRLIRQCRPGDRRRFLHRRLTPDGGSYLWWGPRLPNASDRVEVFDVATGQQVWETLHPRVEVEPQLSPRRLADGRLLYIGKVNELLLVDDASRQPQQFQPDTLAISPDLKWTAFVPQRPEGGYAARLALRRSPDSSTWLEFFMDQRDQAQEATFSPDGSHLAWGSLSGKLTIVDLPALKSKVETFQAGVDEVQ